MRAVRPLALALLAAAWLAAADLRLYLKEGGYHVVREYQVLQDRVRYYSAERGDWEEIPLDLVDLKKTEAEQKSRGQAERKQAALDDAEEKFERALAAEVARIPSDPGVYLSQPDRVLTLKQAEAKVNTDKKRSILKAISPVPVFSGKATLELDGDRSAFVVTGDRPTFYFRLGKLERFGLARLTVKKGVRVVEQWEIAPVVNVIQATRDDVEIFRQQIDEGLYRVWPQKAIAPGEYAWIEYTEGEGNTMVWDFRLEAVPATR